MYIRAQGYGLAIIEAKGLVFLGLGSGKIGVQGSV